MAYSPETHIIEYRYCGKVKLAKPYCERFQRVLEANNVQHEVIRVAEESPAVKAASEDVIFSEIGSLDIVTLPNGLRGVVVEKFSGSVDIQFTTGKTCNYTKADIKEQNLRVIGNVSTVI